MTALASPAPAAVQETTTNLWDMAVEQFNLAAFGSIRPSPDEF